MSEEWDGTRHEREKRNFIKARLRFRSAYLHTSLIFTATWRHALVTQENQALQTPE
jgi:hypothetical protein